MSIRPSIAGFLPPVDSRSVRDVEQEIRAELDFHLAMRTEANIRSGMTDEAARHAALSQFGDVNRIFTDCRQAQLGERLMLQRIQTALIAALLAAVVGIGYQSYSGQRANQTALAEMAAQLARLESRSPDSIAASPNTATPAWEAERPTVVATFPENGATNVDPASDEIRVQFDKPMSEGSWSWVRSSPEAFPESTGDIHYRDAETCVMPVKLRPETKYVIWFNTANYQNFKDREGRPAVPYLLTFTTSK